MYYVKRPMKNKITLAMKAIATISGKTGTLEAAESICTVSKYITGPIFTLVLICNFKQLRHIYRKY